MGSISVGRTFKGLEGKYNVHYNFDVRATTDGGIPGTTINWCKENITNECGWYFDQDNKDIGYCTFIDEKDAIYFALRYSK